MGFFRNNTKRILQEFRDKSEFFSNDLSKEIKESFEDLKSDYQDYENVIPDFLAFATELKNKLELQDSKRLEEFAAQLRKINRCAKNGVEAMRELSFNQRKITTESLRLYEDFEY